MSSTESIAAASEHASTLDSEAVGETAPKVLEVQELKKTFFIGFFRKRVEAVRGVNFTVRQGETFGLLGPNGAGKTTTIKMLLRLIYPTSGSIRLFDQALGSRIVQSRIGYLPENPYVYDYLNPIEFLDLCGRLMGMSAAQRRTRTTDILERVGLSHAKDRRIGKFSKGMTQRVGLAQALLHEPELLILDEPMSGLDPVGRRHVREILAEERAKGRTLLLTSHILSDVEMLCDHVTILNQGRVRASGSLQTLLRPEVRRVELTLEHVSSTLLEWLISEGATVQEQDGRLRVTLEGDEDTQRALQQCIQDGARIIDVIPQRERLEELFIREAIDPRDRP